MSRRKNNAPAGAPTPTEATHHTMSNDLTQTEDTPLTPIVLHLMQHGKSNRYEHLAWDGQRYPRNDFENVMVSSEGLRALSEGSRDAHICKECVDAVVKERRSIREQERRKQRMDNARLQESLLTGELIEAQRDGNGERVRQIAAELVDLEDAMLADLGVTSGEGDSDV